MLNSIVQFFTRTFQAIGRGLGLAVAFVLRPFVWLGSWFLTGMVVLTALRLLIGRLVAILRTLRSAAHEAGVTLEEAAAANLQKIFDRWPQHRVYPLVRTAAHLMGFTDSGGEGLAERAAARLEALGYTDLSVLDGGCEGWRRSGGELFSGVNVPSKAFGEFVEHHYGTPRIPPDELKSYLEKGRRLVILDSRPFEEYHRMNIPGGVDVPGAELAWRVHDLAPDPDTLVVVNCAGRTRSIIGCQSLRNAGIPNPVVALKDGTMGWDLAGFECERGSTRVAPDPSSEGRARAHAVADRVAARFHVRFADAASVTTWQSDQRRTLYLLDVRTREEFERSRVAGSRHAPGGQLVQATDQWVGVRNARIVLADGGEKVRAPVVASWLRQLGYEASVLDEGIRAGLPVPRTPVPALPALETISPAELKHALDRDTCTVLDLRSSMNFRKAHIPGSRWSIRSRIAGERGLPTAVPHAVVLGYHPLGRGHDQGQRQLGRGPGQRIGPADGDTGFPAGVGVDGVVAPAGGDERHRRRNRRSAAPHAHRAVWPRHRT